jgi:hypothetical protein
VAWWRVVACGGVPFRLRARGGRVFYLGLGGVALLGESETQVGLPGLESGVRAMCTVGCDADA